MISKRLMSSSQHADQKKDLLINNVPAAISALQSTSDAELQKPIKSCYLEEKEQF